MSPIETENLATVQTYFTALTQGDMPTLAAQFADDVVWHQPGSHPFSGDKHGVAEIGEMITQMMQASQGSFQLRLLHNPMANGDLVCTHIEFEASANGGSIAMHGEDLFRLKDGKIVEVWLFLEDQAAEDRFWQHASTT